LVGSMAMLLMIISIEALSSSSSYWRGGLGLAYLSDAGRDPPNRYICAVLGTASALIFIVQHAWLSIAFIRRTSHVAQISGSTPKELTPSWYYAWLCACALSCFAMLHLMLLVCFDNVRFPGLNEYALNMFFILSALALPIFCTALMQIRGALPAAVSVQSFMLKTAACAVFWISYFIYFPVGVAVACKRERLTMAQCRTSYSLGDGVCEARLLNTADPACTSPPCTTLWHYGHCAGPHTMRTVTELICMLAALLFHAAFVFENQYALLPAEEASQNGGGRSPSGLRRHSLTGGRDDGRQQPPYDLNLAYQDYRPPTASQTPTPAPRWFGSPAAKHLQAPPPALANFSEVD
jgi:hypothetical protein